MGRNATRLLLLAAAATGLLAGAGCGSSPPRLAAASPSTNPSATATALPSTPPPTIAQITAWVNAAKLPASAIGAPKPVNDVPGVAPMPRVCNKGIAADQTEAYAHIWRWVGARIPYVEHDVFGYVSPAADVVAQVKARSHSCRSYSLSDPSGSANIAFVGTYTFTAHAGIDGSYAFCEKSTETSPAKHKGDVAYICTAAVSRGNVLATVRVFGANSTLSSARSALAAALPIAEDALVKAVPAT